MGKIYGFGDWIVPIQDRMYKGVTQRKLSWMKSWLQKYKNPWLRSGFIKSLTRLKRNLFQGPVSKKLQTAWIKFIFNKQL